REDFDPVTAAL
ncbi:hypothetical protein L195_g058991, partial [Trifolium pratense]